MSSVGLHLSQPQFLQDNCVGFPSPVQEAGFMNLMSSMGSSLKIQNFTPMHIAAVLGDVAACRQLIEAGWDSHEMGKCGFSPFLFVTTIFTSMSQKHGAANRNVCKYREIAILLFDVLYAQGGLPHIKAQLQALDQAFQGPANSANSLESMFSPGKTLEGPKALLYVTGGVIGCSGDEQIALTYLNKVHSKEEMAHLLVSCLNEWTEGALINLWPKLTIQGQVALLETIVRRTLNVSREELFCKLWVNACMEVRQANHWMHDATQASSNRIIAYFLENNTYHVRSVDDQGRTILHYATEYQHKIHPKLYEEMVIRDAGYTQSLFKVRLFGHRFSLPGPFFEGTSPLESRTFVSILTGSIQAWSSIWEGPRKEALCTRMNRICKIMLLSTEYSPSELLYERSRLGSVLILGGPLNHAIDFIFHRDQLVKVDTGVPKERGAKFYDIRNFQPEKVIKAIDLLKKETIEKAVREHADKEDPVQLSHQLFQKSWLKIKSDLDLRKTSSKLHLQTTGNCAWEAHKTAIFVLVFLDIIEKNVQESTEDACSEYFFFQRNWIAFDCTKGFREGFPIVSRLGFNMSDIFSNVIQNCLLQSMLYYAKIEQPIIDILTIEPLASNWSLRATKRITLLECAASVKLDNVYIYLKLLGRIHGPQRITYLNESTIS